MDKPVRVLMVTHALHNPYIGEIVNGVRDAVDITCSLEKFFQKKGHYDIIHIQWPEELSGWGVPDTDQLSKISETISFWKKKASIVINHHNLNILGASFGDSDPLYDLTYRAADAVIHLGNFGYSEFSQRYPQSQHVIIPHHVYESYPNNIDQISARKYLHIPVSQKVILCFGHIRSDTERKFIKNLSKKIKDKNTLWMVPRYWSRENSLSHPLDMIGMEASSWFLKRYCSIWTGNCYIEANQVQYYFHAADIVFIPRSFQLNSGVVFLALAFNRIFVGPEFGNIGDIINKLGYPVYEEDNLPDAARAVQSGLKSDHPVSMKEFLSRFPDYSLKYSIEKHLKLYRSLFNPSSE